MPKKATKSKKKNLTVNIDEKYYNYLTRLGYELSAAEGKRIGCGELLRRALNQIYPVVFDQ